MELSKQVWMPKYIPKQNILHVFKTWS
jgi:hypothetical protein